MLIELRELIEEQSVAALTENTATHPEQTAVWSDIRRQGLPHSAEQ